MPVLTPDVWAQIRYDYEHTARPVEEICAEHGISSATLRDRMRRWRWRRRRPPIPREGPPAFVVVEEAVTPSGTALTVAEPAALALPENASDPALPIGAARQAPGDTAPLAPALQEAVTTLLPTIQRTLTQLAAGNSHPDDAAKYARAYTMLARSLRELTCLLSRPQGRR
ncbi:MAG TPA: hypothetical protein VMI47_07915 [Pseudolabrys sp.]|nr:hypothetical protein [Pseudolabrys sp.]